MANEEDLATYIETDPNNKITVTNDTATVNSMDKGDDANVYKEFRSGYFKNFKLTYKLHQITDVDTTLTCGYCSLGNTSLFLKNMSSNDEGICCYSFITAAPNVTWGIKDYTNDNNDEYGDRSFDTNYYFTLERNGTTLTAKIYSDSARTTLLDTLTITCDSRSYKRLFAIINNLGASGEVWSGLLGDLKIIRKDRGEKDNSTIIVEKGVIVNHGNTQL